MTNMNLSTVNGSKRKTTLTTDAPYERLPDAPGGFRRRPDGDIMDAHKQWTTRPADEAVYTFDEALQRARAVRDRSREIDVDTRAVRAALTPDGRPGLVRVGGSKVAALSNYALSQICARVNAPASYLATLPPALVISLLQHGLDTRAEGAPLKMLTTSAPDGMIVRALTGPRYTRLWDAELAERLHGLSGRTGWGPAQAFKSASGTRHAWGEVTPLPLGWIGDRSSFFLLVDYETEINLNGSTYFRFLMLENSEVGAASFRVTFGLLDMVCANMILWGCTEVYEAAFRHVGKLHENVSGAFAALSQIPAVSSGDVSRLQANAFKASKYMLGDGKPDVLANVRKATDLPLNTIEEAWERASVTERYGDPRSAWGMVSGLTEAAQHRAGFAADRVEIDTAAATLLTLATR